jgi:peptide/nickel transport system substrate-binding protein
MTVTTNPFVQLLEQDMNRRRLLQTAGAGLLAAGGAGLLRGGISSAATLANAAAASSPIHGGTLTFGAQGGANTDTLNAGNPLTNTDFARHSQLYDALIRMDSSGLPQLAMAESITPNKNATEWTVKLRPGIKCHDGSTFRSSDILFTFNRIIKNKYPGTYALGPIDLAQSRTPDALTAVLKFKRPYSIFLQALSLHWFLYMVPSGYNPAKPIGTGPFKLVSFTPGQSSTVVRFADYWNAPKPYLSKVITSNINSETAQVNALQSGQVQAIDYLTAASIATLASGGNAKVVVSKSGGMDPYTMRVDTAPFNDVRVRTAMKLILDRTQLIESVFAGHGSVGNDIFSPYDPLYQASSFPKRGRDIEQAKSLLKAAGHSDLAVKLITLPEAPGMVQAAEVFATDSTAAGVHTSVVNQTATQYFAQSYLKVPFSQDYWQYLPYLVTANQCTITGAPFNETHQAVPAYDKLYIEASSTLKPALQKEIAYEMQKHDYEQGGLIIPFFFPVIDAVATNLQGVQTSVTGQALDCFNFHNFWFSKA